MSTEKSLQIEYIDLARLRPFARNARTHSKKQINQIVESIRVFGFTNPVLIDDSFTILAGHGRAKAAQLFGMKQIPCVRLSSMTSAQKRAYVIADNKLALNAGWDEDLLSLELQDLSSLDLDFHIEVTGFSTAEIDGLVPSLADEDDSTEDGPSCDWEGPPITKLGDLWLLGPHRILCADATRPEAFVTLMQGERADMVFTDPPYNVRIDGNVSGLGAVKHREFAMASGEMTSVQFRSFLRSAFDNLRGNSRDGAIHFICMDWRHISEVLQAADGIYSGLKNLCVWIKDNGGMGTFYRSQHELVFAFKVGSGDHINNFELGQHGRHRTNVWAYRGMNSRAKNRKADLALHPTIKPVALVADAIRDVTNRNGIVLDCFGGSGSTLIASHKTSRRARLIELDAIYVDRTIRRWQQYANDDALLFGTEITFEQVAQNEFFKLRGQRND